MNLLKTGSNNHSIQSAELQGKRANKAKKLIRELIQEETDGKASIQSNADTQTTMYRKN